MKPFDAQTEAAASGKSSTEMATGIITDLRQHNFGNAERNAAILIAQLEHEAQDRKAAKELDAFMAALGEVIGRRDEAQPQGFKPGVFERQIGACVANLEETDPELPLYGYMMGMKNAYLYALAIYQRTH